MRRLFGLCARGAVTLLLGFAAAAVFCLAAAVALGMAACLGIVLLAVFLVRPADARNAARSLSGRVSGLMRNAGGLARSFLDVL